VRDAEFGSVQLRMFGVHSYHLVDAPKFYREVSGTRERFTTEDLADQLLATIVSTAATTFAQSNVPFLDLAASLQTLSATLRAALAAPFAALGLALDSFVVESVSLPSALEQALQTRQAIGIVGNLQTYAQYQAAKSIPDAAQNPSGVAGLGAGVAVGAGIGQVMGRALGGIGLQPSAAAPTSEPTAAGTNRQPSAADAGSAAGAAAPQPSAAPALVPCSACAKAIEPGSGFCRFCGQPQKLVCPGCHKDVAPGSAFCSGCGHKLGA
jgi:membrane protease subunit (stomatin/prohibitin family)